MKNSVCGTFLSITFLLLALSSLSQHESLPIKPVRTLSVYTDEATYMDLDISPDGSMLVFSLLGEIFTMSSSGGKAKQITRGLAINALPVWSPDGKYIAYISDAKGQYCLQVMDAHGNLVGVYAKCNPAVNFTRELEPKWTPDGQFIISDGKAYHIAGGEVSVSYDVKNILGFSGDNIYMALGAEDNSGIYSATRNGKISEKIFGIVGNPRVSQNGKWLSYVSGQLSTTYDSLIIYDMQNKEKYFSIPLNIKFPGFFESQRYCISADSKKIYMMYGGKIHCIDIANRTNTIIPFAANVNVDAGEFNHHQFPVSLDSLDVLYTRSAHASPDGSHLVFSALNKIYSLELQTRELKELVSTRSNQFCPAYSPDGKWIAFVTWEDNVGGHLWKVRTDGTKLQRISEKSGLYMHPSWSPDNNLIVVACGENKLWSRDFANEGQIQVINVSNKKVKIIADKVPMLNSPIFSSDGTSVIYQPMLTAEDVDRPKLVKRNTQDLSENIIATGIKISSILWPLRYIVPSPDGRYIVMYYNENLHLIPTTSFLGSTEIINITKNLPVFRFAKGGIDPHWENGGKTLSWSFGNKYYRIDPDKVIEEGVRNMRSNKPLSNEGIINIDITPDTTVEINVRASRSYGKGMLVLKGGRLITMKGNEVLENGLLIIENGRIQYSGRTENVIIPRNAKIIDITGKIVMPGLIDMHAHLYGSVPPDVFMQQSWQRLVNFSFGVTSIRDPSASFDTFGYGEVIETGLSLGQRIFSVGNAVRSHYAINSLSEADVVVANRSRLGAKEVKQYGLSTRLERQRLLIACKKAGLNMTNEGMHHPYDFIGMLKDGNGCIEHNPVWGDAKKDIITLAAESGVYLTATLQVAYGRTRAKYYFERNFGKQFDARIAKYIPEEYLTFYRSFYNNDKADTGFLDQSRISAAVRRAGGNIVMGSHSEDMGIGNHYEIWALQMGGLNNIEALQSATILAAEGLGVQKDLGSLEPGKIADLIILDANPLDDIHNTTKIKSVMQSGILYDADTLDQLWPRYKKFVPSKIKR